MFKVSGAFGLTYNSSSSHQDEAGIRDRTLAPAMGSYAKKYKNQLAKDIPSSEWMILKY